MSVAKYLDAHADDLARLLQRLVRIETINPPGADYATITEVLVKELESIGLQAERLAPKPALQKKVLPREQHGFPRYNVLGKWKVEGARKTIHFNAHYDVVPVSGNWRHGSPFSGAREKGWIYGRGTGDMKGSIASLLVALRALRATRISPRMNVEVSFTADEETDSELGAAWLVKNAPIAPDYAIVMEGGENEAVCCGHNGVVWLEVVVHGKPAHGSKPEEGINALEKMSRLVLALDAHKQQLAQRTFKTPEGVTMVPTLNVGGVFAQGPGAKINTVPAEARFTIDRRVLAIESAARAEKELRGFLAKAAREIEGCRISVNKISENHPCYSEPSDPFFAAMATAVSEARRKPVLFNVAAGFNDMHFFSHHLKIPTLGYGPGGQNYHAVDERARLKDLVVTAKIYAELLQNFSGLPNR